MKRYKVPKLNYLCTECTSKSYENKQKTDIYYYHSILHSVHFIHTMQYADQGAAKGCKPGL